MSRLKQLAASTEEPLDIDSEILRVMEEEGLGPRDIIREIKTLLKCDPSKLVDVSGDGQLKLKVKLPAAHARGLVEMSPTKLKMVDKAKLITLASELARMQPSRQPKQVNNDNRRVAYIQLPPTISREEAFAGVIDAEVISEQKAIPSPASGDSSK